MANWFPILVGCWPSSMSFIRKVFILTTKSRELILAEISRACQLVPDQQLQPWENNQVRNCHLRKATQEYISWQHQCCVATSFYRHCKMIETKWAVTPNFSIGCAEFIFFTTTFDIETKVKARSWNSCAKPRSRNFVHILAQGFILWPRSPSSIVGKVVRRWLYPSIRIGCLAHLCALSWICGGQKTMQHRSMSNNSTVKIFSPGN